MIDRRCSSHVITDLRIAIAGRNVIIVIAKYFVIPECFVIASVDLIVSDVDHGAMIPRHRVLEGREQVTETPRDDSVVVQRQVEGHHATGDAQTAQTRMDLVTMMI